MIKLWEMKYLKNTKQNTKSNSFIRGALILGIANLLVKVIGAVFKIPLINLIGDDGMGYFNVAYQIYTFMFIIATAGFPIAISKMVAESMAQDNELEAKRIFQTAFGFLSVIGLIGALVLYFFNKQLEGLVSVPGSSIGIMSIAPAVFFVAMASVFRGYFQGRQNMFPTAASEVIEATAKLVVGMLLASIVTNMSVNGDLSSAIDFAARQVKSSYNQTIFASAGAIFGVTVGTLLSFLLLGSIYIITQRRKKVYPTLDLELRSRKQILKDLILIAVPITIGASVSSLTTLIDMGTITRRLVIRPEILSVYSSMFEEGTAFFKKAAEEGWTGLELYKQQAATLYGMYTGKALTMFNLPLTLVVALGMSVVPAISASLAQDKKLDARAITESTIRIAVLFAAPCALGMCCLSKEVLYILFSDFNAETVLAILSIAIIPVAVVSITNAILQAYGKVYYPVINMLIGGLAKVLFNFFFIPYLGIDGAPVGTFICYLVIAVLNMRGIIKHAEIKFKWKEFIFKPLFAAIIMGAVGFVLGTFITSESYLLADGGATMKKLVIICEIGICAIVYFFAAFAVGAIQRSDILQLPKGEKIANLLTKFKLLK